MPDGYRFLHQPDAVAAAVLKKATWAVLALILEIVFRECVALQAQYAYNTFGKFPGTVPSMFLIMYLQAHHLDLEFYDQFYKPGAYLKTHATHMARWHLDSST
jgi:hypothetical protein